MESREKSYRPFEGLSGEDGSIWTTSNEMSTSPMYITVDTSEAFPEMPPSVVIDSDAMVIDSGGHLSDQNVIFVDGSSVPFSVAENQQFEFQGKISVVESSGSHGLFCGECSARLESPVSFFQHWVTHHCQLEQPEPIVRTAEDSTATLTMERCNRCNHIFVEGTQRYKHHLHTCDQTSVVDPVAEKPIEATLSPPPPVIPTPSSTPSSTVGVSRTKRLKSSSSNKYVCGVCDVGVKTVTSFFLHWLDSHQGLRDILQEVWQCRGCSGCKLFPDATSLRLHVDNEHPMTKPKDCDQVLCCPIPDCPALLGGEDEVGAHLGQFHGQLLPGESISCPSCSSLFKCAKEAFSHFRNDHLISCGFCSCDISADNSRDHFLSRHRCEVIWNRKDSLQKVSRSPQVSRICTGANQGPVRLANGAIAKTTAPKKDPSSSRGSLTSSLSTSAKPATSKYTLLVRGDSNDPSEEKGYKCAKCSMVFTNLKVMERHYLSNHEFQCKFCSAVMDKDVYGQHLRQHLASERRKTIPATPTSSTPDSAQIETAAATQMHFYS